MNLTELYRYINARLGEPIAHINVGDKAEFTYAEADAIVTAIANAINSLGSNRDKQGIK